MAICSHGLIVVVVAVAAVAIVFFSLTSAYNNCTAYRGINPISCGNVPTRPQRIFVECALSTASTAFHCQSACRKIETFAVK